MTSPEQVQVDLVTPIAKRDAEKHIAYGVVLEPTTEAHPDLQGDWYTAEDVEAAAHRYMAGVAKREGHSDDVMHDYATDAGYPVESFIAPMDFYLGDDFVKQGSWVIGMHYPDDAVWKRIKDGELAAFSVAGSGVRS